MGRAGQNVFKGINAQAWAAMSMFLQYLRDPGFSYIELEAPRFEDFNLVFNDGKKIICESKAWEGNFSFSNLRQVLNSVIAKNSLGEQDEILIICTHLDDKLKEKVYNMKYLGNSIAPEFHKKNFADKHISALYKVRFWEIAEDFNERIVYSLLFELIDFWLPQKDLIRIADSILVQNIYKGSSRGATFKRNDILSEIIRLKKDTIEKSGYFDKARRELGGILKEIMRAVEDSTSPVWADSQLSSLSSQPDLMSFALDRLQKGKISNLEKWRSLWQLAKVYRFSARLLRIFENNLHTEENKRYILNFFKNNIGEMRTFYDQDFFCVDVVKITNKIIIEDTKFVPEALEIVRQLITSRQEDIYYLETLNTSELWEKEQIAKLLNEIYRKADNEAKNCIYELIVNNFNLIRDEGQFSHYTPKAIFEILRHWLEADLGNRLLLLAKELTNQYDMYYRQLGDKLNFNGWEHGGSTSFCTDNYVATDRHFIGYTLGPALEKYYAGSTDKTRAWKFIKDQCINKTHYVKKEHPDFLNRAVITIILHRYGNQNQQISNEAFSILEEFILSQKGIPSKSELIYQAIRSSSSLSDDKRWKLVVVSTKEYGYPISVFVDEIVSELAKKGNYEAKDELNKWLKTDKYHNPFTVKVNIAQNIQSILDSDFDYAVYLFENFVNSDYFSRNYDSFEAYKVAALLYDILKRDFERGLNIIRSITRQEHLTKNQQTLLCSSLFNKRGNDYSDELEFLEKVYKEIIDPLLNNANNDIDKVHKLLTFSQAREALVQFAGRLVAHRKIKEALRIIDVFVRDSDPYLPGRDPEDPENKYNEHKHILNGEQTNIITSVRGWCGWVLMECAVSHDRDYIPKIIDLTNQLLRDKNWYVKQMASRALSKLTQNRLTVLRNNHNILFFNDDQEKALRMAKQVEEMAFELLNNVAEASHNVQKALGKSIVLVFVHVSALNESDAFKLMTTLAKFPDEVVAEAAYLFIFYAEFRKNAFETWKWAMPGLYDDLLPSQFDGEPFRKLFLGIIDRLEPNKRFAFGARLEYLIRDASAESEDGENKFRISYKYLLCLSEDYGHGIFSIIYRAIKEGMEKKWHFNKWYDLYIKCLRKEKEFYIKNIDQDRAREMYWWPYHDNGELLVNIYKQGGKDKFLDVAEIIFSFSTGIALHENEKTIALLQGFPPTNERVQKIMDCLEERNPTKYYEVKNAWLKGLQC